jgi:valyl-tRNA synthetase
MAGIPDRPSLEGLEAKWDEAWEGGGVFRFDRRKPDIYSIDTPPPTVSGQLHLGTVFGYVQFDAVARFQRMRGREVLFPIGWDDNGLPTERRVQNLYGVRCDPALPYQADFDIEPVADQRAAAQRSREQLPISRRNFVELCQRQTAIDEQLFESVFRTIGLSVDWSLMYTTVGDRCRAVAQRAFLRNLTRDEAYAAAAPTLWDVDFQTAIAQAELEDRPVQGIAARLGFSRPSGEKVEIETTRPELLPACVALVVHPDDDRYRALVGSQVRTPLFGMPVPVLAHPLAEPAKGSGAAMVCTFGDTTDVLWWRELRLPLRSVIDRDGRFVGDIPPWLERSVDWGALAGRTSRQARRAVIEMLRQAGDLIGEPREITHDVKFYEKGDRPLEIVTSRQWYLRNGAHDADLRSRLLDAGRELTWTPDFMRVRYEHWVGGLNSDWLISRQRYFGVPFPLWYPLDEQGSPLWDEPILADPAALPVDPQTAVPPGFAAAARGQAGGFIGDPDVMDTWATASLTPQIVCGWGVDSDLFEIAFPMALRPQGPEIIRTWLFSTVLRSQFEQGTVPWRHATINGWILDPDRKNMSKSKGNIVTPAALIAAHGADGVRYWACRAAPGTDTAVDEPQMRIGRRLAVKLLNASKFVIGLGAADESGAGTLVTEPIDRAMLGRLNTVIDAATGAFEAYQYQQALERSETFFWQFCDDYVELVKDRAYGGSDGGLSARAALALALSAVQRLFAPFLPFVAEEVWSWWQDGSVHRSAWPLPVRLEDVGGDGSIDSFELAASVLREVRKAKTLARQGIRSPVARLIVEDTAPRLAVLGLVAGDVCAAGVVDALELREAETARVVVELE